MTLRCPDAPAERNADHDGCWYFSACAPGVSGCVHDNLLEARINERIELNLDYRKKTVQRHADGRSDDPSLCKRRVDDSFLPELVEESCRDAKHASCLGDVFSHDDDPIVVIHSLEQGQVESLHHGLGVHRSPSLSTSPVCTPGCGPNGFTSGGRSTLRSSSRPSSKFHGRPEL